MIPTQEICLERIQFCISDLSQNGIDLSNVDSRGQARLVREHLDYFQMMLGYDSDPSEVLELLKRHQMTSPDRGGADHSPRMS